MLRVDQINPLPGWIVALPTGRPIKSGRIILPTIGERYYSIIGWVERVGRTEEDIQRDDLLLFTDESIDLPRTYFEALEITFKPGLYDPEGFPEGKVITYADVEPAVREFLSRYRANPSSADVKIKMREYDSNETISCLTSDIASVQAIDLTTPLYHLEYLPTYLVQLESEDGRVRTHYIIHESNVLAFFKEW